MLRKVLDQQNPCYNPSRWDKVCALAAGGQKFHKLIHEFLIQNPMEPDMRYHLRKKTARYHSYMGSIINLYASWLFLSGFEVKAYDKVSKTPVKPDTWYGQFETNVGARTTLKAFMQARFREAMTTGRAVILAEMPRAGEENVLDRAMYDKLGLGNAELHCIDRKSLIDWKCNDDGELEWAILKDETNERTDWRGTRSLITETWRVYEATTVTVYQFTRNADEHISDNDPIKEIGTFTHGFQRVPLIMIDLPEEMCVGEQTYDAQLSHFELDAGLNWAIKLCCYPMPIWHVEDPSNVQTRTQGVGYAQFIGQEDKLEWASPPSESFDIIARTRDSKRDEIFRIVHQMAQGMDNNAETVGRSADSKEIDAAATRIMLNAYGEIVGKAIEEIFELISDARADNSYDWSIEGFTGYDTTTASSLIAAIESAKKIGIPSMTFQREASKKAALALVPEANSHVKAAIKLEIDQFDFELTGKTIDEVVADIKVDGAESVTEMKLQSADKMQTKALKSQAKLAKSKPAPGGSNQ